jgi:formylglycine-generating enzyme required for sulfatase activity
MGVTPAHESGRRPWFVLSLFAIAALPLGAVVGYLAWERAREPASPSAGDRFRNSIGMDLVWIEPGTFMMGSPEEEVERDGDEVQHEVTLTKGFYLGVMEVTRGQFARFVEATGYVT